MAVLGFDIIKRLAAIKGVSGPAISKLPLARREFSVLVSSGSSVMFTPRLVFS